MPTFVFVFLFVVYYFFLLLSLAVCVLVLLLLLLLRSVRVCKWIWGHYYKAIRLPGSRSPSPSQSVAICISVSLSIYLSVSLAECLPSALAVAFCVRFMCRVVVVVVATKLGLGVYWSATNVSNDFRASSKTSFCGLSHFLVASLNLLLLLLLLSGIQQRFELWGSCSTTHSVDRQSKNDLISTTNQTVPPSCSTPQELSQSTVVTTYIDSTKSGTMLNKAKRGDSRVIRSTVVTFKLGYK